MRSFLIAAIAFAVLALAGIAGGTFVIGRASPAGDEQGAKGAYRAFLAGLDKGDQKGVGALLDRRFVWIGADGRSHSRREALKEFPAISAASRAEGADRDVQSQFYGRMFT